MQLTRHGLALATLVAACLCLPWPAADAMPLGHDDMAAVDSYAADAFDPFFANSADDWNLFLPTDAFARSSLLPVYPAETGLNQIARSLRESAGLQQILSVTEALRTPEPLQGGLRAGTGAVFDGPNGDDQRAGFAPNRAADGEPGQEAVTARQSPFAADPARTEPGDEIGINEGDTLRQALRNLVGTRRVAGSGPAGTAGDDDPAFELRQTVLDSRLLGSALDSFIHRTDDSDFEPTFSLFGLGRFSFDVGGNGSVEIAEYSSGLSMTVRDKGEAPHIPTQREMLDVWVRLRAFLATPTGTLSIIATSVLIVVWCMVRMATALRR